MEEVFIITLQSTSQLPLSGNRSLKSFHKRSAKEW